MPDDTPPPDPDLIPLRRLRPKTYSVTIYLVIAAIVIQTTAVLTVFWLRKHVVQIDVAAPDPSLVTPVTPMTSPPPPREIGVKTPPVSAPSLPMPPAPGRIQLKPPSDAERVVTLNGTAKKFQMQGELKLADRALREAEQIDPKNPITLQNIAMLADAQNDAPRSHMYWEKIFKMGPDVGAPYQQAREKLDTLSRTPPPSTPETPPPAIPDGVKPLCLQRIQITPAPTTRGEYEFQMRVEIATVRHDIRIDPAKVNIQLYFYDQLEDGPVTPTKAKLQYAFENVAPTWHSGTEALRASYFLPKNYTGSSRLGRKYYGYLVRIYYQGEFQDQRADPEILIHLFPLPVSTKK